MSKGIEFLMKKNKIDVIEGYGKINTGKKVSVEKKNGETINLQGNHIIIATGAKSRVLPALPQDGKKIIGYRDAMVLPKMPKKLIVVGSGAIGIEFAYFYNAMGTEVTVVEYMPRIVPVEDEDVSKPLEVNFKKNGIKIINGSELIKADTKGKLVNSFRKWKRRTSFKSRYQRLSSWN